MLILTSTIMCLSAIYFIQKGYSLAGGYPWSPLTGVHKDLRILPVADTDVFLREIDRITYRVYASLRANVSSDSGDEWQDPDQIFLKCDETNLSFNCWQFSIVLKRHFELAGLESRLIQFLDHTVVEVKNPIDESWVLVDPSYARRYLKGGKALSFKEITRNNNDITIIVWNMVEEKFELPAFRQHIYGPATMNVRKVEKDFQLNMQSVDLDEEISAEDDVKVNIEFALAVAADMPEVQEYFYEYAEEFNINKEDLNIPELPQNTTVDNYRDIIDSEDVSEYKLHKDIKVFEVERSTDDNLSLNSTFSGKTLDLNGFKLSGIHNGKQIVIRMFSDKFVKYSYESKWINQSESNYHSENNPSERRAEYNSKDSSGLIPLIKFSYSTKPEVIVIIHPERVFIHDINSPSIIDSLSSVFSPGMIKEGVMDAWIWDPLISEAYATDNVMVFDKKTQTVIDEPDIGRAFWTVSEPSGNNAINTPVFTRTYPSLSQGNVNCSAKFRIGGQWKQWPDDFNQNNVNLQASAMELTLLRDLDTGYDDDIRLKEGGEYGMVIRFYTGSNDMFVKNIALHLKK